MTSDVPLFLKNIYKNYLVYLSNYIFWSYRYNLNFSTGCTLTFLKTAFFVPSIITEIPKAALWLFETLVKIIYIYIYIYIAFDQDAKANTVYVICLPGVFYRA